VRDLEVPGQCGGLAPELARALAEISVQPADEQEHRDPRAPGNAIDPLLIHLDPEPERTQRDGGRRDPAKRPNSSPTIAIGTTYRKVMPVAPPSTAKRAAVMTTMRTAAAASRRMRADAWGARLTVPLSAASRIPTASASSLPPPWI
jgi:hypothetical protein